jgi:hypothetical protein
MNNESHNLKPDPSEVRNGELISQQESSSAAKAIAEVRWTPQAIDDLEAICLFIARMRLRLVEQGEYQIAHISVSDKRT